MNKIIYVAILTLIVSWVVVQKVRAQKLKNNRLSVSEFKEAISKDEIQLIDVRTAKEYKSGHIKNALHVDVLLQSSFKKQIETLDKTKPTYIYCRSGKRSLRALHLMNKLGYTHVYDLKGGYLEWNQ